MVTEAQPSSSLYLEVVEELFVVPQGEDVHALILAFQPDARALSPAALLDGMPLLLHVSPRHRLHRDLDAPRGLLGLLPGVARSLVLVDEEADLVRPMRRNKEE